MIREINFKVIWKANTVDSRYLEFDGAMENIRVNRSSTQEELRRYRKRGLFNNERETTRAKFWIAKTSIACPYSRNDFKHIRCFCCCFFLSVKLFESCETTDNFQISFFVWMNMFIHFVYVFSPVALSLNFTHHDVFFFVQYCLFTINGVFLLFNKV